VWAATKANKIAKLVATANITIKVMIFLLISSLLSLCHSFMTHPYEIPTEGIGWFAIIIHHLTLGQKEFEST
jgi:hypothetical protein